MSFSHSHFDVFVWKTVNVEPFLPIFIWRRVKMITYFGKSRWKQLKRVHFSLIFILAMRFANDKTIFHNGNDFCKTIFTHSLNFLCQPYFTFAHWLFGECQCDLSFARCKKCAPFWYMLLGLFSLSNRIQSLDWFLIHQEHAHSFW